MAITTPVNKFSKKPEEVYVRRIRYANRLPIGTFLSSVEVTAEDAQGNDITDDVIKADTACILPELQKVEFYVYGGVTGLRATIKVKVTLDDDQASKLVDYLVMLVRD